MLVVFFFIGDSCNEESEMEVINWGYAIRCRPRHKSGLEPILQNEGLYGNLVWCMPIYEAAE